ncbi:MAG: Zn-ribbon domain-containing OB-fold protein [candidate division WOR-3 bacterium]
MQDNKLNFRATSISDEDIKNRKVLTTRWTADAKYLWDSGIAIGKYLAGLKDGIIWGVKCYRCQRIMVPPRAFCEWCFRPIDEWIKLSDTGTVNTFSICYVTWDVRRIKEPQIPAVIEIDGASKGMGILHLIGGVDPHKIYVGMKVKAVWKPEKDREGAITDILYWQPINLEGKNGI